MTELGYDIRTSGGPASAMGSHCGAGAPRFDIVTKSGTIFFIGCNSPPGAVTASSTGWTLLRWGADTLAFGQAALSSLKVKEIDIVCDEGQDTGPDFFGLAVLDNVDVNGTLVGQGQRPKNQNEGEEEDQAPPGWRCAQAPRQPAGGFCRFGAGIRPPAMTTSPRSLALADVEPARAAIAAAGDIARRWIDNVETVVRGKRQQVELVVAAAACDGHVLIEDVPGTAKTVLARALAQSVDGAVAARIQCTPDLQPSDVTGMSLYDQRTREFEFRPGPVFANVLLADEVNRALPKTQSALLEAMAERQVTVDGETRPLPRPFLLIATENPVELEGTFPLPEAQLDRFLVRLSLGYPDGDEEELRIVQQQRHGHPLGSCKAVVSLEEVRALQNAVPEVYVDELLQRWIVQLVRATRKLEVVELSASVRGSIALERMARAWALVHGREYVEPADVEFLFAPVIGHRLLFAPGFGVVGHRLGRVDAVGQVWEGCLEAAPRPSLTQ